MKSGLFWNWKRVKSTTAQGGGASPPRFIVAEIVIGGSGAGWVKIPSAIKKKCQDGRGEGEDWEESARSNNMSELSPSDKHDGPSLLCLDDKQVPCALISTQFSTRFHFMAGTCKKMAVRSRVSLINSTSIQDVLLLGGFELITAR